MNTTLHKLSIEETEEIKNLLLNTPNDFTNERLISFRKIDNIWTIDQTIKIPMENLVPASHVGEGMLFKQIIFLIQVPWTSDIFNFKLYYTCVDLDEMLEIMEDDALMPTDDHYQQVVITPNLN
jgi:hypothetical protein